MDRRVERGLHGRRGAQGTSACTRHGEGVHGLGKARLGKERQGPEAEVARRPAAAPRGGGGGAPPPSARAPRDVAFRLCLLRFTLVRQQLSPKF
jgi:hypothetical protein